MIDLHTHTFFSDGVLNPSELVYSEKFAGYEVIAITDHVDYSNYKQVIDAVKAVKNQLAKEYEITVLVGVEITYVPPKYIKDLMDKCREYGAEIVVVHGETIAENVPKGTNHAAIEACVDILAHPGDITEVDVMLAKENNVCLEITTRASHGKTNAHVATLANKCGAKLVINNDVHQPYDIASKERLLEVAQEAGADYEKMLINSRDIVTRRKN